MQHFDEGRDIAVRRGAETETLEILCAISLDIINGFAARLFDAGEKLAFGRDAADRGCDRAFREILERTEDDVDGLVELADTYLCTGEAVTGLL